MTATQSFRIYDLLNAQFGQPDKARQLTEAIEAVVDEKVEMQTKTFSELVNKDIEHLRQDMYQRFAAKEDLARTENKIILWIVGLNTVLIGLALTAAKFLFK